MTGDDKDEAEDDYPNQWTSPGYTDLTDRDDEIAAYMQNRKRSVRRKTWRQSGTALRHFAEFIDERGIEPGDFNDDDAEDFINWLEAKDSIKDSTVKSYAGSVALFYDYATRRQRSETYSDINYNAIALVLEDRPWNDDRTTERRDLSLKQMREAILSVNHPLLLCILMLLIKTGMRASELANLDMRDINLDHHWFKEHFPECRKHLEDRPDTLYIAPRSEIGVGDVVNGEERKDPNKRIRGTYVPIDKETKAVILLWLAIRPPSRSPAEPLLTLTVPGSSTIAGDRLRADYIWDQVSDWAEAQGWWDADATLESNVSPNYFRHFFRTVFGARTDDQQLVKYFRGDKGDAMEDYMHYWESHVREPYLQAIYKIF